MNAVTLADFHCSWSHTVAFKMSLMRSKTGGRISLHRTLRAWDVAGGGKQIDSGEAAGTVMWEC